jgi:hypothetical protein
LAATIGAPDRKGLVLRSVLWGAVVGLVAIAIQMAVNYHAVRTPDWRTTIAALGGWQWTAICFAVLVAMAIAVDYWVIIRPLKPRLTLLSAGCFLAFSNIWVLEGAWLLKSFNQLTLFQSCIDPASRELVDTFYQPPPAGCEPFSD